MNEVTYEDWQKNPKPRVMWVWNSNVENKVQAKVIYVIKSDEYPVITVIDNGVDLLRYEHCAEIEERAERIIRSKIDGTYKNKPVVGFDEVMELERRIASQRGTIRVYNNKLKSRLEQVERLKQENKELREKNAELTCQMKRNTFCYSCENATERCYRNEIGCPCEKYKSYKDENAELKDKLEVLIAVGNTCTKGLNKQLTKAKEIIKEMLSILPKENIEGIYEITEEAEQFIREEEND